MIDKTSLAEDNSILLGHLTASHEDVKNKLFEN